MRTTKSFGDIVTTHIWDGSNITADVDTYGSIEANYLRGAGLISQNRGGSNQYYLYNGHDVIVQLASEQALCYQNLGIHD